jgi:hypothetical protein
LLGVGGKVYCYLIEATTALLILLCAKTVALCGIIGAWKVKRASACGYFICRFLWPGVGPSTGHDLARARWTDGSYMACSLEGQKG